MEDVVRRIVRFNETRLPDIMQRKYAAMSVDAFRFFRGSAHLFYEDLHKESLFKKQPSTWLCGDLHIENFGSYKGDNKLVYFDVNDFDEAVLAPFTWDVARMVTSILIGGKVLNIPNDGIRKMAGMYLDTYFLYLQKGKSKHVEAETAKGTLKQFLEKVEQRKMKALLAQRCELKKASLKLDDEKQLSLQEDNKGKLVAALAKWIDKSKDKRYQYALKDVAFRIAGTGSLGLKRYVFLGENMQGKSTLIDMKECAPSSAVRWIKKEQPEWSSDAERVVWVQRMMQDTPPAMLTEYKFGNDWYMLKMLQPTDDKLNYQHLASDVPSLEQLMKDMGMLTASAHLRMTGRKGADTADALMEAASGEGLKKDILKLATDYCKQTFTYFQHFADAYQAGYFNSKE
ncbi:DUF2252 domain-containing protein [Taibaiella soli]|uniref:DUF2252 domain-containing protein n=1 Tax=Taibaiella soli TaxID=1649169 RepID=A0A2W2AFS0_9BACT|nr:DUF2252 family protein [Taibaiella soli]PZF74355.1 DUF2252 domain-containing protein [Taibaiella soli]